MIFRNIKSIKYSNLDLNSISLNFLCQKKFIPNNDIQYKIDIIKINEIESNEIYTLTSNNICSSSSKHPEQAITISLLQGTYRISLKSGGIYNKNTNQFNDCIKSSKGDIIINSLEFIQNDENILNNNKIDFNNVKISELNEFEFTMQKSGKFSIWLNSKNISDLIRKYFN